MFFSYANHLIFDPEHPGPSTFQARRSVIPGARIAEGGGIVGAAQGVERRRVLGWGVRAREDRWEEAERSGRMSQPGGRGDGGEEAGRRPPVEPLRRRPRLV